MSNTEKSIISVLFKYHFSSIATQIHSFTHTLMCMSVYNWKLKFFAGDYVVMFFKIYFDFLLLTVKHKPFFILSGKFEINTFERFS